MTSSKDTGVIPWIAGRTRRIFGLRITLSNQDDIIEATSLSVQHKQQLVIGSQNLHGLYMALADDAFQRLHELPQTLVHLDGYSIVYLSKMHGHSDTQMDHRTAIHDWLPHYTQAASENGWRMYCLGSNAEVNAQAVQKLREAGPKAHIKGRDGYFDASAGSSENQAVLDDIKAFDPHIILVGMGMGRQEQWIMDNLDQLGDRCIITVGACLEYMAGEMPKCPRWFGPFGLEMVWRLVTRPRRYAHRYLVEPWLLLGLLIRSGRLFGLKQ